MYKCEILGCQWEGSIRTTIRDKKSNHYGKKVCPFHASIFKVQGKKKTDTYFKYHLDKIKKGASCEESGEYLNASKMHVCHIFPKRIYKSISDNKINCVYLTWQRHYDFDRLLDTFDFEGLEEKFPGSWSKICDRVRKLLPKIKETGKLKDKFEEYLYEKN